MLLSSIAYADGEGYGMGAAYVQGITAPQPLPGESVQVIQQPPMPMPVYQGSDGGVGAGMGAAYVESITAPNVFAYPPPSVEYGSDNDGDE